MKRVVLTATLLAILTTPAATQTPRFSDLEGLLIEANWVEHFKWRYVGADRLNDTSSPRSLKMAIAPGGNITHSIARKAGPHTRTTDGDGPLGKVFSSGKFTNRWMFEDGKLVYVETLIEGARRLTIAVEKSGDKWSCTLSAALAREQGKGQVISWHLADNKPTEMTDIAVQKGECKIGKAGAA